MLINSQKINLKASINFSLMIILYSTAGYADLVDKAEHLTRKQAMVIAESMPEAKGLYGLAGGKFVNCIEKEVIRPCDTDWVTCVDDAWVVRFSVGSTCPVEHDGRLDLYIVLNDKTGDVISKFPEAEYYEDSAYCLEDYDCLCTQGDECQNFIHAQANFDGAKRCSACECRNNICSTPAM